MAQLDYDRYRPTEKIWKANRSMLWCLERKEKCINIPPLSFLNFNVLLFFIMIPLFGNNLLPSIWGLVLLNLPYLLNNILLRTKRKPYHFFLSYTKFLFVHVSCDPNTWRWKILYEKTALFFFYLKEWPSSEETTGIILKIWPNVAFFHWSFDHSRNIYYSENKIFIY